MLAIEVLQEAEVGEVMECKPARGTAIVSSSRCGSTSNFVLCLFILHIWTYKFMTADIPNDSDERKCLSEETIQLWNIFSPVHRISPARGNYHVRD